MISVGIPIYIYIYIHIFVYTYIYIYIYIYIYTCVSVCLSVCLSASPSPSPSPSPSVCVMYIYIRTQANVSGRRRSVIYILVCSLVLKFLQPGTKISGRPGLGNCELDINELGVTSQHVNEPSDWQLSKLYVWSTHLTGADVC